MKRIVMLALCVSACGSRTGLAIDTPAAGGGAGTAGGSGTGGKLECVSLTQVEPVLEAQREAGVVDLAPAIATSSDDGGRVTLMVLRGPATTDPWPTNLKLRHGSFQPWTNWPAEPALALPHTTFSGGFPSPSFLLAPLTGDRFGLLAQFWQWKGSHGSETFAIDPGQDDGDQIGQGWAEPRGFATRGAAANMDLSGRDSDGALMGSVVEHLPGDFTHLGLACAQQAAGDVVPYGNGYLAAYVTSTLPPPVPAPDATCPTLAPGKRLEIAEIDTSGKLSHLASYAAGVPMNEVSLAPHPNGAFILLDVAGALELFRIDAKTHALVGPRDVAHQGDLALAGFDTSSRGTYVAVAWAVPGRIELELFDEDCLPITQASLAADVTGRLGLLASPLQPSFVVTWPEPSGAVRLARFDCVAK